MIQKIEECDVFPENEEQPNKAEYTQEADGKSRISGHCSNWLIKRPVVYRILGLLKEGLSGGGKLSRVSVYLPLYNHFTFRSKQPTPQSQLYYWPSLLKAVLPSEEHSSH